MNRILSSLAAGLTLAFLGISASAAIVSNSLNLASLTRAQGLSITNSQGLGETGYTVAQVGDLNGDGIPDFVVTTQKNDQLNGGPGVGFIYEAVVYVVFGERPLTGAGAFPASLDLASLDGNNGFVIMHAGTVNSNGAAMLGFSVSAAGDVNGDGIADLLIGVPEYGVSGNGTTSGGGTPGTGGAFVIFGHTGSFPATIDPFADLDGSNGFAIVGEASGDAAGTSVSAAGDLNSDGLADLVIGAPKAANSAGAAYVVYGRNGAFPAVFHLSSLDGTNGFKVTGATSGDQFGASTGTLNNLEGLGSAVAYLVIGAPGAGSGAGAAYVVAGYNVPTAAPAFAIGSVDLFQISGASAGDKLGASVSGVGDLDGDGLGNLIVGAPGASNGAGAAYVIFGASNPQGNLFPVQISTGDIGSTVHGCTFTGGANAQVGFSVQGAGDINGDGFSDLIIGAPGATSGAGAAYVVFGNKSGLPSFFALSSLDSAHGFAVLGAAASNGAGYCVSGGGDVNGDGYADLILGAPAVTGAGSGAAYVIYGGPTGTALDSNAAHLADGVAQFYDVDGDLVTVKLKTQIQTSNLELLVKSVSGSTSFCQCLGLNIDSSYEGSNVVVTVKRGPHGDGKVNIGFINAAGVDLGEVSVPGDLGKILAGSGNPGKTATKSLHVDSLGAFGGLTEDTGTDHSSVFLGPVGTIKIAGDLRDAIIDVRDTSTAGTGKIESVSLGGSLIGGAAEFSGAIFARTSIGAVTIRGDVAGGAGVDSGTLRTGSRTSIGITSLHIGGSLIGGSGDASGCISSGGSIGNVTIAGDQIGNIGQISGSILTGSDTTPGDMGRISIGGSQIGGDGSESGLIYADGPGSNIASVTIGGDVRAGKYVFAGGLIAGGELGPVVVKGSVVGQPAVQYVIRAGGSLSGAKSLAIASLTVDGNLDHALVLGGFGPANAPLNGHAQIGPISIGGRWSASSVTAGVVDSAGGYDLLGAGGEHLIDNASAKSTAISSIASIVVKGSAIGSFTPGEHFGIVAEQIGKVTIGRVKLSLETGPANDNPGFEIGPTSNFVLHEVAPR